MGRKLCPLTLTAESESNTSNDQDTDHRQHHRLLNLNYVAGSDSLLNFGVKIDFLLFSINLGHQREPRQAPCWINLAAFFPPPPNGVDCHNSPLSQVTGWDRQSINVQRADTTAVIAELPFTAAWPIIIHHFIGGRSPNTASELIYVFVRTFEGKTQTMRTVTVFTPSCDF